MINDFKREYEGNYIKNKVLCRYVTPNAIILMTVYHFRSLLSNILHK